MAITISGQNNNDKILASDGVLDSISGFNVVGVMTAAQFDVTGKTSTGHLNVGSNIHIGNAGIITATTLVGNVTGNINHTSNLLFQISGSEKFRVGNGGQFGIAGANYGTAGQVFTSGGSGSAPTWSTIASDKITEGNTEAEVYDNGSDGRFTVTTEGSERLRVSADGNVTVGAAVTISPVGNINATGIITATSFSGSGANLTSLPSQLTLSNNADNRVITGGSGTNLNGEANLNFDGTGLGLVGHIDIRTGSSINTNVTGGGASGTLHKNTTSGEFAIVSGGTGGNNHLTFYTSASAAPTEKLRIDSSGRVMIGGGSSPAQVGDGQLIVYSSDRLHPAIKCAGMSNNYANGWTLLGDNYQTDESQINLGVSYSSSSLVLSRGVKVSGSADDTYLSSQDSYATRPCAIKMDELGAFNFLTTETNATTTTDSAVTLTKVFTIDRVGRIYQRISGRNMHFGASNQLEIGVSSGGDPVINAASGDIQIKDAGSSICVVRSDGFQMYQGIYPAVNNSKDLGTSSYRWANIYTQDLQLSNEAKKDTGGNDVDGSWGDWTLQEGEHKIYMINNRTGKKYSLKMEEE